MSANERPSLQLSLAGFLQALFYIHSCSFIVYGTLIIIIIIIFFFIITIILFRTNILINDIGTDDRHS